MEAIMINDIIEIIRKLNGGSVLAGQPDETSNVDLTSSAASLYIDELNSKYYYFADLVVDPKKLKNDNLAFIESLTVRNTEAYTKIAQPMPNSSYLILFWEVPNISESIYPRIIKLEDNEFFYKKYVFYYTLDEFKAFLQWYDSIQHDKVETISSLLKIISDSNFDVDLPHIRFFIRLLTKVPFFKLSFPRATLKDFESMANDKINKTRSPNCRTIKELNSIITKAIDSNNATLDTISDAIYKKIMEE